jgi:hypothetical protein
VGAHVARDRLYFRKVWGRKQLGMEEKASGLEKGVMGLTAKVFGSVFREPCFLNSCR